MTKINDELRRTGRRLTPATATAALAGDPAPGRVFAWNCYTAFLFWNILHTSIDSHRA